MYEHDPGDHSKIKNNQGKGWPKHFKTKEDAQKWVQQAHIFK